MTNKVELVLSKTYLFKGKVFEKGNTYAVPASHARHLLSQSNERDIPYFRAVDEDAPAVVAGNKRSDKGGKPRPQHDEVIRDDAPVAASETQPLDTADEKPAGPAKAKKKGPKPKPKPDALKKRVVEDDDADKVEI